MANNAIRRGMHIFDANRHHIGSVEDVTDQYFMAGGQQYPLNSGYKLENDGIYLTDSGAQNYANTAQGQDQSEMRVPVIEEQLNVGKRQAELGEVQIHKSVTQEQVNVPVELRREEVHVKEVDVPDRPLRAGETAFQEGTIRVPVRGEEAVVNKQAVVTGEVEINKNVRAEQQTISDTVRREEVHVDDSSVRQNQNAGVVRTEGYANGEEQLAGTNYTGPDQRQTGYQVEGQSSANLREGMEVVGQDGEYIGRVKEAGGSEFRVDRKNKPDINVTNGAIQEVRGNQVVLNAPAGDFNNLI